MISAREAVGSSPDPGGARLPFLDGIRGFAVTAVLLYHFGVSGVNGGLLGVDVFFVLSGFLITSLLCQEWAAEAKIRLSRFWGRRARRLLPGLVVLLLGVAAYAWVLRDSVDVSRIRGDALSSLLYVANWHFVVTSQGYFSQSTAPSPLLHIWSLGVEEQYYLIWPLVALVVLRRRGPKFLACLAGGGALASALLMGSMHLAGFSDNRLYYGTDTRAQALLVGSALGAIAAGRSWRVVDPKWAARPRGAATGLALGTIGAAALVWFWHSFDGQETFLYEGGFLLVALATGAVITSVTSWRASPLARLCSFRPIVYVGRISYGIYLYHWPLGLVIDHAHTGLTAAALLSCRLAATFAAAVLSFHLVEEPIRTGRFLRGWRGVSFAMGGGAATAAVIVAATILPAAATVPGAVRPGNERSGLSPSEHQQLLTAHAFTSDPIRFVMFGDSVALTAALGLSVDARPRYGVVVNDQGVLGCDFDTTPSRLSGTLYTGSPGVNCGSWQTKWANEVANYRPDVVGVLTGRFEIADHLYEGKWMHVGEVPWDEHLESDFDELISIASARGARVVLFTFPYIDPPVEQPDGSLWPENNPARVDALNRDIRVVASTHRENVTLVDLNRLLDPDGHYTNYIDGVDVRWRNDGVHVSDDGGMWLQPRILPTVATLGLQARAEGNLPSLVTTTTGLKSARRPGRG